MLFIPHGVKHVCLNVIVFWKKRVENLYPNESEVIFMLGLDLKEGNELPRSSVKE